MKKHTDAHLVPVQQKWISDDSRSTQLHHQLHFSYSNTHTT